jgi:hypothetical protein
VAGAGIMLGIGGTQSPITHAFGLMQSTFDWHGKAHLPYCVLQ